MKAYVAVQPDWLGKGIRRVADALAEHAPRGVAIVADPLAADLLVRHAIGWPETAEAIEAAADRGQRVAIWQYCVATTQRPHCADWLPLWRRAELVASYYDLPGLCAADGVAADFPFWRTPLGVDGRTFHLMGWRKRYLLGTSGYVAETECVEECAEAVRRLGERMFHLGPQMHLGPHVDYATGLTDDEVAQRWAQCRYVAALRRTEGFELPAIEGLACGARPIAFDRDHYSAWLGESAEYVPEVGPTELVEHLTAIMSQPPRSVTSAEREDALARFSWPAIAAGFWQRVTGEMPMVRRVA